MRHTKGVLGKVVPDEVSLEEGAHLRVSRTGMIKYEEVHLERGHIDDYRQNDKAQATCDPVFNVRAL